MLRTALAAAMLAGFCLAPVAASDPAAVSAADAAPYLGDWTLAMEGANGPGTFAVSLKVADDKVAGEIASDALGTQPFASITKNARGLALGFTFPYEGMTVDAVVSLVPAADGKMDAAIDFAGGAYTMSGTGTKKTE